MAESDATPGSRPVVRADLVALTRYHSPQVEVEVRLNTNEAAEPPPAGFTADLAAAVREIRLNRYPDRGADGLRRALADRYGLSSDWVYVANGSNEILQNLLLAYGGQGRTVAVFEPTYMMYSQIARSTGTRVVSGVRGPDFRLDEAAVGRLVEAERPEVVILCSPNNPTGILDPAGLVSATLEMLAPHGGLLVVDEAYGQFASTSATDLLDAGRSLVVSRTFSKTWAMAGLRLGYLLGPPWCTAELDKVTLPYHVDSLKQAAGVLALGYGDEMDGRVAAIISERKRVTAALGELPVTVWPSEANFVLFRPETVPGHRVWEDLLQRSILVRDFSSTEGLAGCLRVTIGTEMEDDRFLVALREVLP